MGTLAVRGSYPQGVVNRIRTHEIGSAIGRGLSFIPEPIRGLCPPAWFEGDDVFTGLSWETTGLLGRSSRSTTHVNYPWHMLGPADRRRTTVVLREDVALTPAVVVHEWAHVLDERLRFEHLAKPVSWYAEMNRMEAFAEAFTAWVLPFGNGYGAEKDHLYDTDRATVALFERLAAA